MLSHDLRQALRGFRRSPAAVAGAVALTALGIAAVTAVFTIVNAVLLRSLPYEDPGRLVVALDQGDFPVSPANFVDLREAAGSFKELAAAEMWSPSLRGPDRAEQVLGVRVTANMFLLLGAQPLFGRTIRPENGKERVAVLSHGLWQRLFGGDPGIVGATIRLNDGAYTVIGVMPEGFQFPPFWATETELWAPLDLDSRRDNRSGSSLRIFGRLKTGSRIEQAQAEIKAISSRLVAAYPEVNRGLDLRLVPLHEKAVGKVRPMLLVTMAASGLVLLIACANIATLLLARATGRRKELAIRAAVGADRQAIMRQLLIESTIHALAGGVAGILLAEWALSSLLALASSQIPRLETVAIDGRVVLIALGVSLLSGIAAGLFPALSFSDRSEGILRESGSSVEDRHGRRLRNLLTVGQVALALTMAIASGLLTRSFIRLAKIEPGFDPQNLLALTVSVAGTAHSAEGLRLQFLDDLQQQAAVIPGVRSVSLINHLPLAGDMWGFRVSREGTVEHGPTAAYRVVEPRYFETMRIRMLHGRDFITRDDMQAPRVIIINRALADLMWPGSEALGKRLTLDDPRKSPVWLNVIGVVDDVKQAQWAAAPAPEVYLPLRQSASYLGNPALHYSAMTLVVRTASGMAIANPLRSIVYQLDKDAPVSEVTTMNDVIARQMSRPRFVMFLVGLFGVIAVVLALSGVYCVIAYSVGRRTREIGIRMALGANRSRMVRMVVLETVRLVTPGVAVGLLTAIIAGRLMSAVLYGITPGDPLTLVTAAGSFSLMIIAAGYLPARRASRIDPAVAIRRG